MTARTRYEAQELYAEQDGVKTYRGVDPVTGLPVLIYRFRRNAARELLRLDSEFIPRLLGWRDDSGAGVLVVAWSSAYVPLEGPLDNAQLLDSARALREAAKGGVVHGDLRRERFLQAGGSVVIEGFGVPWNEEAGEAADVAAWARSVVQLGHAGSPGVSGLLEDALEGGVADAETLLGRLTDVLLRSAPLPPARTDTPEEDSTPEVPDPLQPEPAVADAPPEPAGGRANAPEAAERQPGPAAAPDPSPDEDGLFVPSRAFASETHRREPRSPATPPPAEVAAAETPQETPAPRSVERRNRRVIMATVLAVLGIVLAVLLRLPGLSEPAPPPTRPENITYVIDVLVEPAELPPVNLYVVEGPPGSSLRPGSVLGTAPRRMALDPGTWVFEGRFQGRVSEPVTITVPEDRLSSVTIRIPPAED